MTEWPKVSGCKPADVSLRRFESCSCYFLSFFSDGIELNKWMQNFSQIYGKNLRTHSFRVNMASQIRTEHGLIAAKKFLNHSNLQTTELYVRNKMDKEDIEKMLDNVWKTQQSLNKNLKSKTRYKRKYFDFESIQELESLEQLGNSELNFKKKQQIEPSATPDTILADSEFKDQDQPVQEKKQKKKNFSHYKYKPTKKQEKTSRTWVIHFIVFF